MASEPAPLDALLELQVLDRLPRTGWVQAGIPAPETVGAHTLGVALLVALLGPRVEPPLDVGRAVQLALLHDLGEARLGDLPRSAQGVLPPGVKQAAERAAARELLAPLESPASELLDEAIDGASREARFVRAADRLQLGLRLVAYLRAGHRGLGEFRDSVDEAECGEFAPLATLQRDLQAALEALPT